MQIFFSICPVVIYVIAGYLLTGSALGGVTAGTLVAFTTLQSRLFFPLGRLLQVSVELQASLALFERIFGYLDISPDIADSPGAVRMDPGKVRGRVSFESVRLSYGNERDNGSAGQRWALGGVSFHVEPGQLAAFVGPSVAGKTTISYMIPRLYDPTEGVVRIDGLDVREISLESLVRLTGYVTQESYLFHASIRSNLLYGNPEATQQQIEAAARAAYIHERIMDFPEGYDTVVGERGYRLSGGERQIQAALEPLMRGRTTIAIAHRLSTILSADVIFAMDEGRIVEQGTHAELLRHRGLCARLYEDQFEGGRVECRCEDGVVLCDGTIERFQEPALSVPGR